MITLVSNHLKNVHFEIEHKGLLKLDTTVDLYVDGFILYCMCLQ